MSSALLSLSVIFFFIHLTARSLSLFFSITLSLSIFSFFPFSLPTLLFLLLSRSLSSYLFFLLSLWLSLLHLLTFFISHLFFLLPYNPIPSPVSLSRTVILATGMSVPNIPAMKGIDLARGYETVSINPDDFEGKAVLILGNYVIFLLYSLLLYNSDSLSYLS